MWKSVISSPTWWFRTILGFIQELWYDWKFYKYEMYIPDWEQERKGALAESERHKRRNHAENCYPSTW